MHQPPSRTAYDPQNDWLVYVLVSLSSQRTYVGIAHHMDRRLAQHNGQLRGGASSTRAGRPWAVGATFGPYGDRGKAQSIEAKLKRTPPSARLDLCAASLEP